MGAWILGCVHYNNQGLDRESSGYLSIFPMSALSSSYSSADYGDQNLLGRDHWGDQLSAGAEGAPIRLLCS
jgi:hypothetical protein